MIESNIEVQHLNIYNYVFMIIAQEDPTRLLQHGEHFIPCHKDFYNLNCDRLFVYYNKCQQHSWRNQDIN